MHTAHTRTSETTGTATPRMRLGLVGCGRVSRCHFDAIARFEQQLQLAAVCDNSLDKAQEHALRHGGVDCLAFNRYSDMLEQAALDMVILCTPSGQHAQQTVMAAASGLHVVCEKPMATNLEDAQRMMAACEQADRRLFIVMQNRYNPTLQLLRRAIADNRFGQINLIQINVFWHRSQSYYDQAAWRGTFAGDGGALMNQASHYVDLLHWLFADVLGDVHRQQAFTATLERDIEAEDTCVLNFRWEKGALGTMSVTTLTYPEDFEGSITILGKKGTVRLAGKALNHFTQWQFADSRDYDSQVEQTSYETDSVYGFGHSEYYRDMLHRLHSGTADTAGDDCQLAYKALQIICAAYAAPAG